MIGESSFLQKASFFALELTNCLKVIEIQNDILSYPSLPTLTMALASKLDL